MLTVLCWLHSYVQKAQHALSVTVQTRLMISQCQKTNLLLIVSQNFLKAALQGSSHLQAAGSNHLISQYDLISITPPALQSFLVSDYG